MTLLTMLMSAVLSTLPVQAGHRRPTQTAEAAFLAGNYQGAVKILTEAIAKTPQDASLYYWALRSYYEMGDVDNAISYGEKAVDLDDKSAEYVRWLGRAYGAKAEKSHSFFLARKVKHSFEAAVDLDPSSIPARRDLMQYLTEAPWIVGGSKGKAVEQIEAIAKLDPIEGYLARGAFYAAQKKWPEAEAAYAAAVDAPATRVDSLMEAAEFFMQRKNARYVERAVEIAARLNAKDPRLDFYRAVSLVLRGADFPVARKLLQSYMDNTPQRSDYPSHSSAREWFSRANE
jgi:tetratricopeptide (TPR) repeat protein